MENVSIIEELHANRQCVQMKFRQMLIARYTCSIYMALFWETMKIIQLFFLGFTPSLQERIISLLLIILNKKWYMHGAFICVCVCVCVCSWQKLVLHISFSQIVYVYCFMSFDCFLYFETLKKMKVGQIIETSLSE